MPVPRPYREGVLGRPVSVSPLTARSQADRDLVALVFSGLVRNGPDGTIVPDLAERWTVNDTGAIWTFYLRPEARWQDGEPVTAEDVAFTIRTLQDPAYTGPAAGSWNEVKVATPDSHTVVMTLATPLGGFLQAATQPIAPAHLLADTPVGLLAQHPFGRQPIGSGPFAVISLDEDTAELVPSVSIMPPADSGGSGGGPGSSAAASDPLASAPPSEPPSGPSPYLAGIEMTFYDTPEELAQRLSRGFARRRLRVARRDRGRTGHRTGQPGHPLPELDDDRGPAQPATRPSGLRRPEGPDRTPRRDRPACAHHDGLRGHGQ